MCTCVCIYVSVCATLVPCYLLVGEGYRVAAFIACVRGFECVCVRARACAPHVGVCWCVGACVYVCAHPEHTFVFARCWASSERGKKSSCGRARLRRAKVPRARLRRACGCLSTPECVYAAVSLYLCICMRLLCPWVCMPLIYVCVSVCLYVKACNLRVCVCVCMRVPSVRDYCMRWVCVHDIMCLHVCV